MGVTLLEPRADSVEDFVKHERFHSHVIEELKSYLSSLILYVIGRSVQRLRITMAGPRIVWPSASVLPGPHHLT